MSLPCNHFLHPLSCPPTPLWLLNEFCLCLDELIGKRCAEAPHLSSSCLNRDLDNTPSCSQTKQVGCMSMQQNSSVLETLFPVQRGKTGNTALRKLTIKKELQNNAPLLQLLQLLLHCWPLMFKFILIFLLQTEAIIKRTLHEKSIF